MDDPEARRRTATVEAPLPVPDAAMATLLAHLTDLHVLAPGQLAFDRVDTAAHLRAAIDALLALPELPDAVVLTGDLVETGQPAEYEHLARLLAPLPMPVHLLPGNHDDRGALRRVFHSHATLGTEGFVKYSTTVGALRLVALDTTEPGRSAGRLCAQRLQWLDAQLRACRGEPVVIAMHHPPFATGIGEMDRIGLVEGAAAFASVVARHSHVQRIICGHVHRTMYSTVGGTVASIAPSTAHHVALRLGQDAPALWTLEPPAFHLHRLPDQGPLVTHVVPVGDFGGARSFDAPHALEAPAKAAT